MCADRASEPQASTVRPAWLDRPEQAHWRLPSQRQVHAVLSAVLQHRTWLLNNILTYLVQITNKG